MQPEMHFTAGYCRSECVRCSEVCPAGAIKLIDTATKSSTKIGTAVVDPAFCLAQKGESCGNCVRHCPVEAVQMVETPDGKRPVVDESRCIGCGACEYHCPVGNTETTTGSCAAIHVEAIDSHREV